MDNNTSNVNSSELSSQEINQGFYEIIQRLDTMQNLENEHNAGEAEQLSNIMLAVSDSNESDNEEVSESVDYQATLESINDQLVIQNQMIASFFFISGLICGVILLKILWDRFIA